MDFGDPVMNCKFTIDIIIIITSSSSSSSSSSSTSTSTSTSSIISCAIIVMVITMVVTYVLIQPYLATCLYTKGETRRYKLIMRGPPPAPCLAKTGRGAAGELLVKFVRKDK